MMVGGGGGTVEFVTSQLGTDHNYYRRPRLSILHRTHGFYLWSFHYKLASYGVLLISLFVCDLQYR
jgi:hypothetical protein